MKIKMASVRSEGDLVKEAGKLVKVGIDRIENMRWLPCEGLKDGRYSFVEQNRNTDTINSWRSPLGKLGFVDEEVPPMRKGVLFNHLYRELVQYIPNSIEHGTAKQLLIDAHQWEESKGVVA